MSKLCAECGEPAPADAEECPESGCTAVYCAACADEFEWSQTDVRPCPVHAFSCDTCHLVYLESRGVECSECPVKVCMECFSDAELSTVLTTDDDGPLCLRCGFVCAECGCCVPREDGDDWTCNACYIGSE